MEETFIYHIPTNFRLAKNMNDAKIHKDYKRTFLAITVTLMLMLAAVNFAVPTFGFGLPAGADAASWYTTVEGVLDTDTYALYPYQKKSLTIGFSQFGEMINALPGQRVGLQYGDRDPFAPPAGNSEPASIPQRKWFSGWHINITYRHATATPKSKDGVGICITREFGHYDFWQRLDLRRQPV